MAMVYKSRKPSEEDSNSADSDLCAEQIDDVVQQLNGICRASSLEFALRVGAVVIHNFYGGDTTGWRARGPKVNSFRRLAQHPDLQLSAGALYRCVAIFELCDRLRAPARWRRLGASHLRAVIGIPLAVQEHLLTKANDEQWSVQLLQAQAQSLRESRARGGRRVRSPLRKQLRALDQCLRGWHSAIGSVDQQQLDELEESLQLLAKMKTSMDELARAVEAQRNRVEAVPKDAARKHVAANGKPARAADLSSAAE